MTARRVRWPSVGTDDIAPPRSLGRCAPAVRLRRALRTLRRGHERRAQLPLKTTPPPPRADAAVGRFSGVPPRWSQKKCATVEGMNSAGFQKRAVALHVPPVRLPAPLLYRSPEPVRCYRRVISYHAWLSGLYRWSVPGWTLHPCRLVPDCCACSGDWSHDPTRKSTQKRHWQQPLVTEIAGTLK